MTDPLTDLRRADAHARWLSADAVAMRPESAAQLASQPVHFAGWMDDEEDDEEGPGYCVEAGVAIVPVCGALMDRAGWWWDGYDAIQKRCDAAHADPAVRAVMLDLDSPGGMVAGLFDCMAALRAAKMKSGKRTVAWVASGAYSAAYGLASTCDEIVTSDTGGTGSVGVIASLTSRVDQLAQDGVDVRVVCATHQDLQGLIAEQRFREDLYYRLAEIVVNIPALRERRANVPLLLAAVALVGGLLWWAWVPRYRPALRPQESFGVDVSNHQGSIDWPAVRSDGIDFAVIKATEGGDSPPSSAVQVSLRYSKSAIASRLGHSRGRRLGSNETVRPAARMRRTNCAACGVLARRRARQASAFAMISMSLRIGVSAASAIEPSRKRLEDA